MSNTQATFLKAFARTASAAVGAYAQSGKPKRRRKKGGCTPCEAIGNVVDHQNKVLGPLK